MQPITDEIIQEIKNHIVSVVHTEKIIIFSSYAYGIQTKDSDLNLLVILPTEEPMHNMVLRMKKLLRDIRVPKDILVYTPQEVVKWKNVSSAFITSIIKNGKVIYG